MAHTNWRAAVEQIRALMRPATAQQRTLAQSIGIELVESLPLTVASARLQDALAEPLQLHPAVACTDAPLALLDELATADDSQLVAETQREVGAWIGFLRLRGRAKALAHLQLQAGDIVEVHDWGDDLAEVSSIGSDGRIYFKGGMSRGAWPDRVRVIARTTEESETADEARRTAANERAMRARISGWSLAKQNELSDFLVEQRLTLEDIELLQGVLDSATDERPIQRLVEQKPQLLTALVGGESRFCVPQVRLGAEFIPDFLIGGVDSAGIRWTLVELETPRSAVTLVSENQLDKFARKGVSQIETWREWLTQNLDYARRSRGEQGLGLPDIRPNLEGLVIVGRRARLQANANTVRHPLRERARIHVHTYDWWTARLLAILKFDGPWGLNPHLISPSHEGVEW